MDFTLRTIIILSLLIIVFFQMATGLYTINRSYNNCLDINRVNSNITTSLKRSKKVIPTLPFYKHHPQERREALKEINNALGEFQPNHCDILP